ncbi:MAG: universal stress protein [Acidimicrobiales bacterium]
MGSPTSSDHGQPTAEAVHTPTTVVVPLDGSSASARSLQPAKAIARAFDADLSLVSVVMPSFVSTVTDRIRGQAAQAGVLEPAITLDISSMAPADRLLATLDDDAGILLCMATTGRSRFGQVLGSVAEALLRARTGPFVLIGPECRPDTFGGGGPLIVPVDGSDTADSVLGLVELWSERVAMTPRFITVVDPKDVPDGERAAGEANAVRRRAERLPGADWEVLHHTKPATAIVEHAVDVGASMIAMATHGRTGLPRVVLGSVAMEIAHRAPCPVLVHRPLHLRTA